TSTTRISSVQRSDGAVLNRNVVVRPSDTGKSLPLYWNTRSTPASFTISTPAPLAGSRKGTQPPNTSATAAADAHGTHILRSTPACLARPPAPGQRHSTPPTSPARTPPRNGADARSALTIPTTTLAGTAMSAP